MIQKYETNTLETNMIDTIYDTLVNSPNFPKIKPVQIEDGEVTSTEGKIEVYYWLDEIYTEKGIETLPEKKLMHVTMSINVEQIEEG